MAQSVSANNMAIGGDVTTNGSDRIHTFTNSGLFEPLLDLDVDVLVVGGGGGGGETIGGGGGGGGMIYSNAFPLVASNYTVTVGGGGAGGWGTGYPAGLNGENSAFDTLVAIGGGAGAGYNVNASGTGGSGGGNGGNTGIGATNTPGQGYPGGSGGGNNAGGGGGGAGQAGFSRTEGGHGGEGLPFDISGSLAYYGGGGGGGLRGNQAGDPGNGGLGGGGNGGKSTAGQDGSSNTGGGGGGGGYVSDLAGGSGGSGIVIVRYLNDWSAKPLGVRSYPETGRGVQSATLNGRLLGTGGGDAHQLYICLDYADKGIGATSNWLRVIDMGAGRPAGEGFSTNLTDLIAGSNYVYRHYVTNSTGDAWSAPVSFRTMIQPVIVNDGTEWRRRHEAGLRGTVTDDGADPPTVWLEYWDDGGGTTSTVPVGVKGEESFVTVMEGLGMDDTYHFRFGATNTAGAVWSATDSVTTLDTTPREWYIATNGLHSAGTNWTTAITNLQVAFDLAANGDTFLLAGQTFEGAPDGANPYVFMLQNVTNIALSGGYAAEDDVDLPGARDSEASPTIIRRSSGDGRVLVLSAISNAVIEQVRVRDGYHSLASGSALGGGVYLTGCRAVSISDCHIDHNTARSASSPYGGGLYLANSYVTVTGGTISSNFCQGTVNTTAYGGGVYVNGSSRLTLTGVALDYNRVAGANNGSGWGGGFYVATGGQLDLYETVLVRNRSTRARAAYEGYGGGGVNLGTLLMQNVLVAKNFSDTAHSDGIFANGGTASLVNCTVADNGSTGLRVGSGSMTVTNSIIWGHSGFDLRNFPVDGEGLLTGLWYSCTEEGRNSGAQGCVSIDPLFVDRTHYHLQSTEGHVTNGYFSGGTRSVAAVNSPLIDRGAPASDYSLEPHPNGERINMGAYGGTAAAAQTADIDVDPPSVANPGALAWGHRTALLRGEVTGTGGEIPEAWFLYWEDGGTQTNRSNLGLKNGVFELPISGLLPGSNYYYAVVVSNRAAAVQSASSLFSMHPVGSVLHVSTNGNNTAGTNWSTAYTDLQMTFDISETGDQILVAGHTFGAAPAFATDFAYRWRNVTNVALRGGYAALSDADLPGARDSASYPTIIRRSSGNARVLVLSAISNAVIEQVTVRDGNHSLASGSVLAGGIYLTGCRAISFEDCQVIHSIATGAAPSYGGGLYLANSHVSVNGGTISSNTCQGTGNTTGYGGGVYVNGSSRLTLTGVMMDYNRAIGANDGHGYGGGFHVASGGQLEMRETVLIRNRATRARAGYEGYGGGGANLGSLLMQNVLVAKNVSDTAHSDGIFANGGTATLINCTVADNGSTGLRVGSGSMTVTNSIIWGHSGFDLRNFPVDGEGVLPGLWYSCTEEGRNAGVQGCLSIDPLFADRTHYHLQSTVGHVTNGYFSGGSRTVAAGNSPLIDRGDPASDFSLEPDPNGGRINMGAYGGTAAAAQTAEIDVDPPSVANPGALAWGHRTASLRGEVTDTGGEIPEAWFLYWEDGGAVTSRIDVGLKDAAFEMATSGFSPGVVYYYAVVASNRAAAVQSASSLFAMHPEGSTLYVSTNGNNTAGTNWSTAYVDLQTAFDISETGDEILLAGHTFGAEPAFGTDFAYRWRNVTNVTLRGGYAAQSDVDLPGGRDSDASPTVVQRASGNGRVLVLSAISNAVIEQVTIRNGNHSLASGSVLAGGVYLTNCRAISFEECQVIHNTATGAAPSYGGGLYLANSHVSVTGGTISSNTCQGTGNTTGYGGGVYVNGSSRLTLTGVMMEYNRAAGANNGHGWGGGFHVVSGGQLEMRETVLIRNRSTRARVDYNGYGGGGANLGTLLMQNVLVARNYSDTAHSDGIFANGGAATLINCTVADNGNTGLRVGSGSMTVTNSIIRGHSGYDLRNFPVDGEGVLTGVGYSLFGGIPAMHEENGCLVNVDPLFVDTTYYHLQSAESHYLNGYFSGGTWSEKSREIITSPAVDAGDPTHDWLLEPFPHGRRINLGAYGGTAVASMTPTLRGSIFVIR